MNKKADRLYIILTGIIIASLVSCNLIFQKFFQIDIWIPFIGSYTFEQSVGLLPYPVTFIVTDIVSPVLNAVLIPTEDLIFGREVVVSVVVK